MALPSVESSFNPEVPAEAGTSTLPRSPWLQHPFLTALGLAALVVAVTIALDWFLLRQERWKPMATATISDVLLGAVAFVLLLFLLRAARERHKRIVQRLETIDEMNHHIRNALQVIAFNVRPNTRSQAELGEITQAVNRIHWTLREILPKVEPEYEPLDGPIRPKDS